MKKSLAFISACIGVHLWLVPGCAAEKHRPTTRPTSVRDRQDAAMRDPMGYSPDMSPAATDISGGTVNELDRGALRKDIDHVLNP